MECIYQHFFRAQRRTSLMLLNCIEIIAKIAVLVLGCTSSNSVSSQYIICTAVFLVCNCVLCCVAFRYTQNKIVLQVVGLATWMLQATQLSLLLWDEFYRSGDGADPVAADGLWYAMYVVFAAYTTLPVGTYISWVAAFCTTIITMVFHIVGVSDVDAASTSVSLNRQVSFVGIRSKAAISLTFDSN